MEAPPPPGPPPGRPPGPPPGRYPGPRPGARHDGHLRGRPIPPGLGDPEQARFAWARFRRIMAWMTLAAALSVVATLLALGHVYGALHWATILGVIGGVGGSVMMAAALMGLAFLSSGTGHDEDVERID